MYELLHRRIIYADLRYYFDIGRVNAGKGGLQSMRSEQRCRESKSIMKAKWGDYILFDENQPGTHCRLKVRRRQDWTV